MCKTASSLQLDGHFADKERKLYGIVFREVVLFIEEIVMNGTDTIPVFKLSDLIKLYDAHLKNLKITLETRTYSKRFKNRLLWQYEDLSAHSEGKEVILVFIHNIEEAITSAAGINYDDDGYILAKAANILRRYVGHNDCWINFCMVWFSRYRFLSILRGFVFIKELS